MANELLGWGMTFVALAVALMIGGGLVAQTKSTVDTTVGSTTLVNTTFTNVGNVITTFTGYLPILGLAIVGGLALFYVVRSLGAMSG